MEKPFELQQIEVLAKRVVLTGEERKKAYAMASGFDGELIFVRRLHKNLPSGWCLLTDLKYKFENSEIQIDAMIITSSRIFLFEVKNLKVYYTFEDGDWFRNGVREPRCHFDQLKRTTDTFRNVMGAHNQHIKPVSKLVLIHDEDTVTFNTDMSHSVLKRWQIGTYLEKIKQEEAARKPRWNVSEMKNLILHSQTIPGRRTVIDMEKRQYKKGILCRNCGGRNLAYTARFHIACTGCGHTETTRRAMMRTICEYSVMFPDNLVTKKELLEFINNDKMTHILTRLLNLFFKKVKKGRVAYYELPGRIIDYAFPNIIFRYEQVEPGSSSNQLMVHQF